MNHRIAPDVSVAETEDGMVLLEETTGRYWMLNTTGAAVVRGLGEGHDVPAIVEELRARFPGAADRVAADVAALLDRLTEARLVKP